MSIPDPAEERVESARSPEMKSLFLPLAPNPVMGGFLAHIPTDRIMDVDMTVEEGVQSIITSGLAVSGGSELSRAELREMGVPEEELPGVDGERPDGDRMEEYETRYNPVLAWWFEVVEEE